MKKLFEYTLGEMQEICKAHGHCYGCIFESTGCNLSKFNAPSEWKLKRKIFFTDGEVEAATVLVRCFGEELKLDKPRYSANPWLLIPNLYESKTDQESLAAAAFPSLQDVPEYHNLSVIDIIENKGVEL